MIEIKALASSSVGNCYHISDGVTPLLLDCGLSFRELQRGLGFSVSAVAACLVSHEHKDHCKAVGDLMRAGVDIYMSEGTRAALGATGHRVRAVRAREQLVVGSWAVLPFETQHDAAEPLGYLLASATCDKLIYLTDSFYCRYRFRGLTHIMLECNYADDILDERVAKGLVDAAARRRIKRSHFSLANVKHFLQANDLSRVQAIWLLHLSGGNSDTARFKREIQELTGRMVFVAET